MQQVHLMMEATGLSWAKHNLLVTEYELVRLLHILPKLNSVDIF